MKQNRKIMARVLSLAMTAMMVFGLSATAFAAGPDGPDDANISGGATENSNYGGYPSNMNGAATQQFVDRGWTAVDGSTGTGSDATGAIATLTVSGIDPADKATVMAYQVIKPVYAGDDQSGQFLKWANVDANYVLVKDDGTVKDGVFTRDMIGKLGSAASGNAFGAGIEMKRVDGTDTTYTCKAAPGSYVILVGHGTNTDESSTYGPMIVSAYYSSDTGKLQDPTLTLVQNQAFAKKQQKPTIDKTISDTFNINGTGALSNGDVAVANHGDWVWFDILVKSIPEYHGDFPEFLVTDTISGNLEFDPSSVQLVAFYGEVGSGHTADDDSRWNGDTLVFKDEANGVKINKLTGSAYMPKIDNTTDKTKITFDFAPDHAYKLNDYAGFDMIIRYRARVNSENADYTDGNIFEMPNSADLKYSRNSAINGDCGEDNDDPDVYTYSIKITAKKTDANGAPLPGATFELLRRMPDDTYAAYYAPAANDGERVPYTVTSDENGDIVFTGLGIGNYRLVETEAPDGFVKSDKTYDFWIDAYGGNTIFWSDTKLTQLDRADYTPDGEQAPGVITIANSRMSELPSTGGAGTALLVGFGIIGIIGGCVVLFGTRKKQED